jgi:DNA-binding PadR family transcriptional regulator
LGKQGWIALEWKISEHKQRIKLYRLTALGRKQLTSERSRWQQLMVAMAGILNRSTSCNKNVFTAGCSKNRLQCMTTKPIYDTAAEN